MSGAGQEEDKKPVDQSAHINLKVKGQVRDILLLLRSSNSGVFVLCFELNRLPRDFVLLSFAIFFGCL